MWFGCINTAAARAGYATRRYTRTTTEALSLLCTTAKTVPTQFARVDLMTAGASAFSVAEADIVRTGDTSFSSAIVTPTGTLAATVQTGSYTATAIPKYVGAS